MPNSIRENAIRTAINQLMSACGLRGESGTEELFLILRDAVDEVDWGIVEESHREGLCFDVSCLLAEAIEQQLSRREQ